MRLPRWPSLVIGLSVLAATAAGRWAGAEDVPYWPSEQEGRLAQLDRQVLDTMRALSAARLRNDHEEAARLSKEFKAIQDERAALLRAAGLLPPAPPR